MSCVRLVVNQSSMLRLKTLSTHIFNLMLNGCLLVRFNYTGMTVIIDVFIIERWRVTIAGKYPQSFKISTTLEVFGTIISISVTALFKFSGI